MINKGYLQIIDYSASKSRDSSDIILTTSTATQSASRSASQQSLDSRSGIARIVHNSPNKGKV